MEFEKEPQPKSGSPKIELPTDPELILKLRNKLEEYKSRLAKHKERRKEFSENDPYKSPDQTFSIIADAHYKIAVLEAVLQGGSVDTQKLSDELAKKDETFSPSHFENACAVIDGYCKGETNQFRGGTGLKAETEIPLSEN